MSYENFSIESVEKDFFVTRFEVDNSEYYLDQLAKIFLDFCGGFGFAGLRKNLLEMLKILHRFYAQRSKMLGKRHQW